MSVSSTITTASAPEGIGAPVAISMHSPGADRLHGHLAGEYLLDAMERSRCGAARAGGVLRANGVAVHGRARERRDVGGRDDGLGQHAPAGTLERHTLDACDRRDRALDDRPRLVQRNRALERPHLGALSSTPNSSTPFHSNSQRSAPKLSNLPLDCGPGVGWKLGRWLYFESCCTM